MGKLKDNLRLDFTRLLTLVSGVLILFILTELVLLRTRTIMVAFQNNEALHSTIHRLRLLDNQIFYQEYLNKILLAQQHSQAIVKEIHSLALQLADLRPPTINLTEPAHSISTSNESTSNKAASSLQGELTPPGVSTPHSAKSFLLRDRVLGYTMYDTLEEILAREDFHKRRIRHSQNRQWLDPYHLIQYSLETTHSNQTQMKADLEADYARVNAKFSLEEVQDRVRFCVLVLNYNNNVNFRIEQNLNTLFTQNYTNFHAVIIDDRSKDGTADRVQRFLDAYAIGPDRAQLVQNKQHKTALENIFDGVYEHCPDDEVVVTYDGDDELIGWNVLSLLNSIYHFRKAAIVYTTFIAYSLRSNTFFLPYSKPIAQPIKTSRTYRSNLLVSSQLRSFRSFLFKAIPKRDLQENGMFFKVSYDVAIMMPLLELACGKTYFAEEKAYLYNVGTGMNDFALRHNEQARASFLIRSRRSQECHPSFSDPLSPYSGPNPLSK